MDLLYTYGSDDEEIESAPHQATVKQPSQPARKKIKIVVEEEELDEDEELSPPVNNNTNGGSGGLFSRLPKPVHATGAKGMKILPIAKKKMVTVKEKVEDSFFTIGMIAVLT
jgi:hypothetical protein